GTCVLFAPEVRGGAALVRAGGGGVSGVERGVVRAGRVPVGAEAVGQRRGGPAARGRAGPEGLAGAAVPRLRAVRRRAQEGSARDARVRSSRRGLAEAGAGAHDRDVVVAGGRAEKRP